MKVTVDINLLLDVFQKREPHYAASARVLAMVQQGELIGVFPAHGFTTLDYLVGKHASRPNAETAMDKVREVAEMVQTKDLPRITIAADLENLYPLVQGMRSLKTLEFKVKSIQEYHA